MHVCDFIYEWLSHVFFDLIHSVKHVSAWFPLRDQRAYLEAVEGWAHIVVVLVDLVIVEVQGFELSEISELEFLYAKFGGVHTQVVAVALVWEAGESDLKEAMLLGFYEGVHGCAATGVSIDLEDLRGTAVH
jgi:hypothetical protein